MQAGALRSTVITRFAANTAPSDSCPPACAGTGLPSSRAELSERAMSLCPVPPGAAQNESAASVLVSATMTRLTTGDLSVRSFEAYIRDFTFVWLIPLSSWASARRSRTRLRALRVAFGEVPSERRSPFCGASPRSQPSYRHVVFFAVQIPLWSRAFRLGVSGAEAPSSNRACGFPAHGFPCETGVIGISFL